MADFEATYATLLAHREEDNANINMVKFLHDF